MTQERMERLLSMAQSEDERVRKLCLSILLNDDFKEYGKLHMNYQTLDLNQVEPFDLLASELILHKENYDFRKLGIIIDHDDYGSELLTRDVYTVADGSARLVEDIIDPKLIKK